MSVQVSGDKITFSDNSVLGSAQVGMKNRIIDGGFIINQRVYTSGTSLSSGSYGHDRWKAGSGGGTYTFTQGSLGVNTTITITAGTLVQVIEGCNLAEGGTYVLSWTGTAQGRLNGGSYGSSGSVTVTGWTAGTNLSVEFNTGTLGSVQLEKGSTATSFDYRPYSTELALCQRYYQTGITSAAGGAGGSSGSGYLGGHVIFPAVMRSAPTVTQSGQAYVNVYNNNITLGGASPSGAAAAVSGFAHGAINGGGASAYYFTYTASSEL